MLYGSCDRVGLIRMEWKENVFPSAGTTFPSAGATFPSAGTDKKGHFT